MQQVRLQEVSQDEVGRVPRTVEVELTLDTCDTCMPGDVVTVCGVVKVVADEASARNRASGASTSVYLLYLSALSLSSNRSRGARTSKIGIDLTYTDYAAIQEIHGYGDQIFKLLVNSLCPSIFGQNVVKAALLLGLFGGTKRKTTENFAVRGDPHILIVGDPGMGKSQILSAVAATAPRGVFVTGNTSTTSGLTVTLSKEAGGETSLEAGALVLADQGCCCIDEFDKMTNQHQALLEAMEQQSISIAKAGMVCSLPARSAILAAANPVGGHYNRAKTVSENLKLNPALLSRFDLVFILIDKPDSVIDSLLSGLIVSVDVESNDKSLKYRLQHQPGDIAEDFLPTSILRKYIAYARKYVFPKLTPPACAVLQVR
ncbi:DNA helicase MCM8 [Eurytemora carolleeae]|uniref:DNA helicase MCM8 n=1 Tax=Eurytemora carolleeae TaxID=1294199 RepID=UPI000C786601|nr:DNA helicase MCM8 [Eurytemora carolleeae]|eukprot:XP_023328014.1 DNA helicase MCM8-like [Eurytemora affinis]